MSGLDSPKRREETLDAVVVVPGIMGSELVDGDGTAMWGLHPRELAAAYQGGLFDRLAVTDGDLTGVRGVRATRLLTYPAVVGWFRGSEDYNRLLSRVAALVADRRAVLAFPYDWRLPVASAGARLATEAADHLQRWRQIVRAEGLGDPQSVSLTIVAHSMGGLVTRAAQNRGLDELPLKVLTLGTPFYGAVKAARLLAEGKGAPLPGLPAGKVREFAVSSPGVYDLLPRYRCVTNGPATRALSTSDVVDLGGHRELADTAEQDWHALNWAGGPGRAQWRSAVGVDQPTLQSLEITAGEASFFEDIAGVDEFGDGTVYRRAAGPGWQGYSSAPVFQSHAALISSPDSHTFLRDKLLDRDSPPPLGTSRISVRFPDIACAGQRVTVRAARFAADDDTHLAPVGSAQLLVSSTNLGDLTTVPWVNDRVDEDGWLVASHVGLAPGLHRVEVTGGPAPVTDLLWVGDPS